MIKVVATKTLYAKWSHRTILFKEGDILTIKKKENSNKIEKGEYTYEFMFENGEFSSCFNDYCDLYKWSIDEIKDYYITLAEWREKQINSILDE